MATYLFTHLILTAVQKIYYSRSCFHPHSNFTVNCIQKVVFQQIAHREMAWQVLITQLMEKRVITCSHKEKYLRYRLNLGQMNKPHRLSSLKTFKF